jgi:hypothetical protein
MENEIKLKLLEIRTHRSVSCKRPNKIHPTTTIQHEIAAAKISLTKIMQGNYLNLTVLNELMYATAAVTADQVREKRTPNSRKDLSLSLKHARQQHIQEVQRE